MNWKSTIDSVAKLELLYFFFNNPSTMDSAASLSVWAGVEKDEAEQALRALVTAGLFHQSGEIFYYAPPPELIPMVQSAVESYKTHRILLRGELQKAARERGDLRRSLQVEQSRGAAVLESVSEGILLLEPSGKVQPLNACGRDFLAKVTNPSGEVPWTVRSGFEAAQRKPGELIELGAGESVFRVRATKLKLEDAGPAGEALVLTLYDVTREAETERLKQDLTRMITHDLRSPVSGISTAFDLLLRDGADGLGSRQRHIAEVGRRSALYILGLVNNLLDIGRLEDGRLQLSRGLYHLEELLETALVPLEGMMAERKVGVLRLHPETQRTRVSADRELMVRVLGNLLANAVKFSEQGSELQVECGHQGHEVFVSVQDFGDGIPEPELERVFEKYYRVAGGKAAQVGGTGLGLYFVRLVMESHGGRVVAHNGAPKGACFTVWLPAPNR